MSNYAHNFTRDELLSRQVEAAVSEKDWALATDLMRGKKLSRELNGSVLEAAVSEGNLEMTQFIFEEQRLSLSPETTMLLLLKACKSNDVKMAAYLCERVADTGQPRVDGYALAFSKFQDVSPFSAFLLRAIECAQDKQDAQDNLLLAAAREKRFDIIPRLIEDGGDANVCAEDVLRAVPAMRGDVTRSADNDACLAVIAILKDGLEDMRLADVALVCAVENKEQFFRYPALTRCLIEGGADPFFAGCAAMLRLKEYGDVLMERELFDAQANWIKQSRAQFETLFGHDYRVEDLLMPLDDGGETGLMLAVRAFKLEEVMAVARKKDDALITFADITRQNARGQSVLSLALDRTMGNVLFAHPNWVTQEPHLLEKLSATLTPAQKNYTDMDEIATVLHQQRLQAAAAQQGKKQPLASLRLKPRLTPKM